MRANTRAHIVVFAVAQFYEKYGYGARVRDLGRTELGDHLDMKNVASSLSAQYTQRNRLTAQKQQVEETHGKKVTVNVYAPTKEGIEELEDAGVPTKFPDGTDIPADWNLKMPSSYVETDEDNEPLEDIEPAPDIPNPVLHYRPEYRQEKPEEEVEETAEAEEPEEAELGMAKATAEGEVVLEGANDVDEMMKAFERANGEPTPLAEAFGDGSGRVIEDYEDLTDEFDEEAVVTFGEALPEISDDESLSAHMEELTLLTDADPTPFIADAVRRYLASLDDEARTLALRNASNRIEDDDLLVDVVSFLVQNNE